MTTETTPDVQARGASNPANLIRRYTMTNLLSPETEIKSGVQEEASGCGPVADGVAAQVAANLPAKLLKQNDVAGVADDAAEEDGAKLLDDIRDALQRHVVMRPGHAEIVALWIMHAHTLNAHQTNPRLILTSLVPNSGKTTLAGRVKDLTRGTMSSNLTIPVFFRMINDKAPQTIIIDEADTFLTADNKAAIGILNSGHGREGAYVYRCDGDNHEPRRFCTWAPVVIALIGKLPASSLETRSIVVPVHRKRRDEHVERVRRADRERDRQLATRAIGWAAKHIEALSEADPMLPDCLYNRDQDNWRPLLAIADAAGGHWPETAREIAIAMNGQAEDPTEVVMLLTDIRGVFERERTDRLSTERLIHGLCADEERPWKDYQDQGWEFSDKQLARLLRPFGIGPKSIRIGDRTPKGYLRACFEDAFDRYLPSLPAAPAPAATSATVSPINTLQAIQPATAAATSGATSAQQAVG
jgi:Protein of unknown function (DUF3631)